MYSNSDRVFVEMGSNKPGCYEMEDVLKSEKFRHKVTPRLWLKLHGEYFRFFGFLFHGAFKRNPVALETDFLHVLCDVARDAADEASGVLKTKRLGGLYHILNLLQGDESLKLHRTIYQDDLMTEIYYASSKLDLNIKQHVSNLIDDYKDLGLDKDSAHHMADLFMWAKDLADHLAGFVNSILKGYSISSNFGLNQSNFGLNREIENIIRAIHAIFKWSHIIEHCPSLSKEDIFACEQDAEHKATESVIDKFIWYNNLMLYKTDDDLYTGRYELFLNRNTRIK